ncbi:MAG: hypothetical protein ACXU7Z_08115 [Burkholderiaceae bacterium]
MKKNKLNDTTLHRTVWPGKFIDAGDGSCDCIVEFPDELCEQMDWKIGDEIDISIGQHYEIILKKRQSNFLSQKLKSLLKACDDFFNNDTSAKSRTLNITPPECGK